MTNNNNNLMPKENFKKVEEVREIKNEVPSFEEFMKTYEADGKVNYDDLTFSDISEVKGYGPCLNSWCGCDCSSYDCNCPSAEASIYKNGAFSVGNYSASGKGRIGKTGPEKNFIIANGQVSRSVFRLKDSTGDLRIFGGSVGGEIGPSQEGYTAKVRASADVIDFKSSGFEGRVGPNFELGLKADSDNLEVKAGLFGVTVGKKMGVSTPVGEIKVDTDECVIQ